MEFVIRLLSTLSDKNEEVIQKKVVSKLKMLTKVLNLILEMFLYDLCIKKYVLKSWQKKPKEQLDLHNLSLLINATHKILQLRGTIF